MRALSFSGGEKIVVRDGVIERETKAGWRELYNYQFRSHPAETFRVINQWSKICK